MNFVAVTGADPTAAPDHHTVEPISRDKLCQPDLYEAMIAARKRTGLVATHR
jgi:hypothetical protein